MTMIFRHELASLANDVCCWPIAAAPVGNFRGSFRG
jgi:hypothetical protein